MKKALYFFPDNITTRNTGSRTWSIRLLEYFKKRGISVDFVSTTDFSDDWNKESVNWLLENKLAEDVHLLYRKPSKKNIIKYFFSYKLPNLFENKNGVIPNLASRALKQQFNEILKKKRFDYIIISYAHWAGLIQNNPYIGQAKTIVDTHDFLTSQFQSNKHFKLGASFEEEIRRLRLFEEIWATSTDEQYVFGQFCQQNEVRLVTTNLDNCFSDSTPASKRKFDLIYVASNNPNNQRSAKWFFEYVYPLLSDKLTLCVIGKINDHIKEYSNVVKIDFAEDLSPYYQNAKIAICPMLAGTGIKIKVVEAFSYGLPVVGTIRAIDGLPNKINNSCLISNDPKGFVKAIEQLLTDEDLYKEQQRLAKEIFNACFSTEVGYKNLDEAFKISNSESLDPDKKEGNSPNIDISPLAVHNNINKH